MWEARAFGYGLHSHRLKLQKRVNYYPTRLRKVRAELQHVPIRRVVSIQHWFRHVHRLQRRVTRHAQFHPDHILKRRARVVVDSRKAQEERENGGAGGEEVVDGDLQGRSWFHCGGAEEIDYEGFDGGGFRDLGERGGYVGGVSFDEAEALGGAADGGGWCGGVGEAEEGDGGVCGGDAADVGVDGGVVPEAGGEEDVGGEMVSVEKLC